MKRSLKHLFVFISIFVSLIASSIGVMPVQAASAFGIVPLGLPEGWRSGYLQGVWGSGASDVYAAGYGVLGSTTLPLLYRFNGSAWGELGLSLPAGWTSGYLFDVWGSSATDIYVVGSGHIGGGIYLPLLYHNNGAAWTAFSLSLPAGWNKGYLYGIWGSNANDVYAVGYGYSGTLLLPLLYHYNGSIWSEAGLTAPVGWNSVSLSNVWSSSASNVHAVGYATNGDTKPFVYQKGDSTWSGTDLSIPSGWTSGYLQGVYGVPTQPGTSNVFGAGYGYDGKTTLPLIYQNTGSGWIPSPLPLPAGLVRGYLYNVWGSGISDVYVVGSGRNNENYLLPLMYHNDGNSWSEASPLLPAGWPFGFLEDVWGSSADDVYAVGTGYNGSSHLPLLFSSRQSGQDLVAPGNVTGLIATTGTTTGSIDLSWIAPADDAGDDNSGPVTSYLVKYSTSPFTSWADGTPVTTGVPAPAQPNTPQTMTISGLSANTQYYFAVRAQDEQYNLSATYEEASAKTIGAGIWYIHGQGEYAYGVSGDIPVIADYNGDRKSDVAVFRPSTSTWYVRGVGDFVYGTVGDVPVIADYNGDGRSDIAVFRPSNSTWYIYGVGDFVYGAQGDIPVIADYNGDKKADIAVFRPSTSTWHIRGVGDFVYGAQGDIPVIADYNGDGKADVAVFRPSTSTWHIRGVGDFVYGTQGDIPVIADYNGDGKADVAVFRPSTSTWHIYGVGDFVFGAQGDIPVMADYNGDGKADIAIFRP